MQPDKVSELDRKILSYISSHGGVISISLGAQELSITLQTFTAAIERLKAAGLLNQE
jgi:DNA-binding Lrp family transcriptional regulator